MVVMPAEYILYIVHHSSRCLSSARQMQRLLLQNPFAFWQNGHLPCDSLQLRLIRQEPWRTDWWPQILAVSCNTCMQRYAKMMRIISSKSQNVQSSWCKHLAVRMMYFCDFPALSQGSGSRSISAGCCPTRLELWKLEQLRRDFECETHEFS